MLVSKMTDITKDLKIQVSSGYDKVYYSNKHIGLKHKDQDLYILGNGFRQVLNKTKVYKMKKDLVLLLGGTGTRMTDKPNNNKHLVNVNGVPMVEHIKRKIQNYEKYVEKFDNKYVVTNGKGVDQIMSILGQGYQYFYQEKPTGIADAMTIPNPQNMFFLHLGDQFYQDEIGKFVSDIPNYTKAKVWLKYSDQASKHTTMFTRDNMIYKFREKPDVKQGNVVTGLYMFDPSVLKYIEGLPRNQKGENNLADLLNEINLNDGKIVAQKHTGYWHDVGTDKILDKVNEVYK